MSKYSCNKIEFMKSPPKLGSLFHKISRLNLLSCTRKGYMKMDGKETAIVRHRKIKGEIPYSKRLKH